MAWFIFIACIIIVTLYLFFNSVKSPKQTDDATETDKPEDESISTSTITIEKVPDSIDHQSLNQSLARFCGAIRTIRSANITRDEFQKASLDVWIDKENRIYISSAYDHDSNYDVESALERGGYLSYLGFSYIFEGFTYSIEYNDSYQKYDNDSCEIIKKTASAVYIKKYISDYFDNNVCFTKCSTNTHNSYHTEIEFHFYN